MASGTPKPERPVPGPQPVPDVSPGQATATRPVRPPPARPPAPTSAPASQPTRSRSAVAPTSAAAKAPPTTGRTPAPAPARAAASQRPAANNAPASTEVLPQAPNPQRELESSDAVRRTVRGAPSVEKVRPSAEMDEMRRFEESAFPKPGVALPSPPTTDSTAHQPRPSAINPPEALRSHGSHGARGPAARKAPRAWLSKLALPDLPMRWDPRVLRFLEFYRTSPKGRAIMGAWLRRMGRYRAMILRVLKRHKLPRDLIYVAMVESGFDPKRTSRVGAGGLWQFMTGTGRGYGLHRDYWVDERRNPKLATEAAARYLKDLYARFGSWELALAAYNAGYGAVQRSVRKYNTNDYWQLCQYESGLPWSTSLYVPKILAAAVVGHNRRAFGLHKVKPDPAMAFELASVPVSVTLAQAARAAGTDKEQMQLLNPELRRGRTPPSSKAWIRVPKGSVDRFYAKLKQIKGGATRYRPYVVRLGDTVESIAGTSRASVATLRRINGMQRSSELHPGLVILVPARPEAARVAARPQTGTEEPLLVAVPDGVPSRIPGRRRVFYRTVWGDTLQRIASHLHVGPDQLAQWNKLDPGAKLLSGMVLQAFVPTGFDARRVRLLDPAQITVLVAGSEAFLDTYEQRNGRLRLIYTARKGDTLRSVGRRFGLSVGSVARINRFSRRTRLKEGQRVVVYVNPDKLRGKARTRFRRLHARAVAKQTRLAQRDAPQASAERSVAAKRKRDAKHERTAAAKRTRSPERRRVAKHERGPKDAAAKPERTAAAKRTRSPGRRRVAEHEPGPKDAAANPKRTAAPPKRRRSRPLPAATTRQRKRRNHSSP